MFDASVLPPVQVEQYLFYMRKEPGLWPLQRHAFCEEYALEYLTNCLRYRFADIRTYKPQHVIILGQFLDFKRQSSKAHNEGLRGDENEYLFYLRNRKAFPKSAFEDFINNK